jgi:hypothetical protein
MSLVIYNGVHLLYPDTVGFKQTAVYDDLSGTDRICTRFDIQIQSVINANYLSTILPGVDGISAANAGDVLKHIRARLIRPRRSFSFKVNGVELIPNVPTNDGFVDVRNGPQPQSCDIMKITHETFLLSWHVTAHYFEKNKLVNGKVVNQMGGDILYNRWSETVDIDARNFSVRTREGKYMIRSDNQAGQIVDHFRNQMAVLGVPNDQSFLRDSTHYVVSPDGLSLQYRIVDREVFKMPPEPAYRAEGYTSFETGRNAGMRWYESHCRLEGSRQTFQGQLIQKAVAVCVNKLQLVGAFAPARGNNKQKGILEKASVRAGLYDNWVEATMRALWTQDDKNRQNDVWILNHDTFTQTPLSDGGVANPPKYPLRGTAGLLLHAAAYYDPGVIGAHMDPALGVMTTGFQVGKAGKQREP